MKRFLAILLSVLMIMSTMSFVVSADAAVKFESIITFTGSDVLVSGAKVRFNVEAADGATVVYKNNGTVITPEVIVNDAAEDGKFTQTVAVTVNKGVNVFTAEADGVVSAATTIKAVDYALTNIYDDAALKTAFGSRLTFAEEAIGGVTDAYAVNTGNRVMNGSLPLTGTLVQTLDFYCADFLNMSVGYAAFPSVYATGSGASHNEGTMYPLYVYKADARIASNTANIIPEGGSDIGTGFILSSGQWHTSKMVLNAATGEYDYYIDDIMVIKGAAGKPTWSSFTLTWEKINSFYLSKCVDLYLKNFTINTATQVVPSVSIDTSVTGEVAAGTKIEVTYSNLSAGQRAVAFVNGVLKELISEGGKYYVETVAGANEIYAAVVNTDGSVAVDVISGNEIKTDKIYLNDTVISIDTTNYGDVPAGTKIGVAIENLRAGNKVVAFVNGVANELTPVNGVYGAPVAAGFNEIYAAVVDASGNIVNSFAGAPLKTESIYVYGLAFANDTSANMGTDTVNNFNSVEIDAETNTITGVGSATWGAGYSATLTDVVDTNEDGVADAIKILNVGSSGGPTLIKNQAMKYMEFSVDLKFEANFAKIWNSAAKNNRFISFKDAGGHWYYPFGLAKNATGTLNCVVYDKNTDGTYVERVVALNDVDVTAWHNYKVVIDPCTDSVWIYIDNVLRVAGVLNADWVNTAYPNLYGLRSSGADFPTVMYVDNFYYNGVPGNATTGDTFAAKDTSAFINVTADGIGLVPANLAADEKAADMAIVARADDNTVEIFNYNAATATDTYKYFGFAKPANKVFVWKWSTLKPIVEAFNFGE